MLDNTCMDYTHTRNVNEFTHVFINMTTITIQVLRGSVESAIVSPANNTKSL